MKKKRTTLKMRGLHTPRFLLWILGFIHGRVKAGGIDDSSGKLSSAFITGRAKRFNAACLIRVKQAEENTQAYLAEADQLVLDLADLDQPADELPNVGSDSEKARAKAKAESERADHVKKRLAICKRLSYIENSILAELYEARTQCEATREVLLEKVASYGHGLILKAVEASILPDLVYPDCKEYVLGNHKCTWDSILSAVEKEEGGAGSYETQE